MESLVSKSLTRRISSRVEDIHEDFDLGKLLLFFAKKNGTISYKGSISLG